MRNFSFILILLSLVFLDSEARYSKAQATQDRAAELKIWFRNYPPANSSIPIERVATWGEAADKKGDIFLWDPTQLKCDEKGNIYVLDRKSCRILKYDANGFFVGKLGHKGQGPGEFVNPYCFTITKKHIVVSDVSRYDIQFFDFGLNYVKSFRVFKSYMSIAANENLIFAMPMRSTANSPLIDVLDESGKVLYSFGESLFPTQKSWAISHFGFINISSENEILVAFIHFPTVIRYDLKGSLLGRIDLDLSDRYFRYMRKFNKDRFADPNNRTYWPIISNMRPSKNGFYILKNTPYIGVIEYDYTGKKINEFWTERSIDYLANDFIVKENKNILLLIKSPDAVIDVFRPRMP